MWPASNDFKKKREKNERKKKRKNKKKLRDYSISTQWIIKNYVNVHYLTPSNKIQLKLQRKNEVYIYIVWETETHSVAHCAFERHLGWCVQACVYVKWNIYVHI